jgi:SpoVK/Ycf46/Vps4 family AAA+-type ATPase
MAAAVATEIDASFYSVDAASIMSKWLGEAEKNVAKLFRSTRERANSKESSIIFIDEIDSLLGLHSNEVGGEIRVRNQFLKEMDDVSCLTDFSENTKHYFGWGRGFPIFLQMSLLNLFDSLGGFYLLSQNLFVLGSQQVHLTNFMKVQADRVIRCFLIF